MLRARSARLPQAYSKLRRGYSLTELDETPTTWRQCVPVSCLLTPVASARLIRPCGRSWVRIDSRGTARLVTVRPGWAARRRLD